MNLEQIKQAEATEDKEVENEGEEDIFFNSGILFSEEYFETQFQNLDQMDKGYIKNNLSLIQKFDRARNQKEASMFYREALSSYDKNKVKEVYDFVKTQKQKR